MVMNQDYAMDSLFQNKEDHVLEIYQTILEYADCKIKLDK